MELTEFQFPVDGAIGIWFVPKSRDAEWRRAFPSLDVTAEYRKAYAWIQANPTKRKTPRGMPTFLFGWLERAQNSGHAGAAKDARCAFHLNWTNNRRKPPGGWYAGCPVCKEAQAALGTRQGDATPVRDLVAETEARLAAQRAVRPASRDELEALRQQLDAGAGGS